MASQTIINVFKFIIIILLPVIILKCASQLPPGGGEVDKIPPEIIEVYPEIGTTNFSEDYFEITFSEYVDKRSVKDAVFISPAIEGELDFDWSGKSLEVSWEDTLKENTTYTVSIGSDVVDHNNRNRMAETFNLIFSTGDEIDMGMISGKVYNERPAGVMVFAYRKSDSLFNPSEVKPDFISQVGEKGDYKLIGLANGGYRILAVRDEFRDFLYNIEQDQFGSPYTDVLLTDDDSAFINLNFFLAIEDTTPPHLQSAVMTDRNHILIEFNENIDSTLLSTENFTVVDSTANNEYLPKYFFKGQGKTNQFFLSMDDSLSEENQVYLVCENFTDTYSNKTIFESSALTLSTKPDTLPVKLLKRETEYSNNIVDFENPYISFFYDDAFDRKQISNALKILDASDKELPYSIKYNDDSSFKITIARKLKPKSEYSIEIDYNLLTDAAGNSLDSVFTFKFSTINDLDFTGISGTVLSDSDSVNAFVVLQNLDVKNKIYKNKVDDKFNFDFEKIIPGKYLAWSFFDRNDNEEYDNGNVYPYKSSEQFIFYPDTINARARWPVGDVLIQFK